MKEFSPAPATLPVEVAVPIVTDEPRRGQIRARGISYAERMKRTLYMETFGCQMNVLDSELVLSQLRAQGYESVEEREDADVIIYNTCSVREHAEQKVWSRLGELRQRKTTQPDLVIGVIGCMAERDGDNIFKKFPHVDILCGPGELDKLPAMVHNAVVTGGAQREGEAPSEPSEG